jgi:hypothetical protein
MVCSLFDTPRFWFPVFDWGKAECHSLFFKVVIIAKFDCCHRLGGAEIDRTPNFIRQYSVSVQKRETETGGIQEI